MTDRETLEQASQICRRVGWQSIAADIRSLIEHVSLETPPSPGISVRIAVAVDKDGNGEALVVSPGRESDTYCLSRIRDGSTAAEAIVIACLPRRKIPVVDGKVEVME